MSIIEYIAIGIAIVCAAVGLGMTLMEKEDKNDDGGDATLLLEKECVRIYNNSNKRMPSPIMFAIMVFIIIVESIFILKN